MFSDAINTLAEKGLRVEIAFDDRTILRFMAYGLAAAIVSGLVTGLIKKAMT